jgi:hypothetical protein
VFFTIRPRCSAIAGLTASVRSTVSLACVAFSSLCISQPRWAANIADDLRSTRLGRSCTMALKSKSAGHLRTLPRGHRQELAARDESAFRHRCRFPATACCPERQARKGGARAVYWGHAAVKRAALAIIGARSQDWYVLARLALQAAVRIRDDVVTLLDDPRPRSPAKPRPVEAMAPAIAAARRRPRQVIAGRSPSGGEAENMCSG